MTRSRLSLLSWLPRQRSRSPEPQPNTGHDTQTSTTGDGLALAKTTTERAVALTNQQSPCGNSPHHDTTGGVGQGIISAPMPCADAQSLLDALPDAAAVIDLTGTVVAVNQTWRNFAAANNGHVSATDIGVNYLDVTHRSAENGCLDAVAVSHDLLAVMSGTESKREFQYYCGSPVEDRWFQTRVTPLQWLGEPAALITHCNVSVHRRTEERLTHLAGTDPLTNLANRRTLLEQLSAALQHRPSPEHQVGILYADANDFKPINDVYGHSTGDDVLVAIAKRLQRVAGRSHTTARMGGDEFVIIVREASLVVMNHLARNVLDALKDPITVRGESLHVSMSVGFHLAEPGESAQDALDAADRAMYQAKARGDHCASHTR